MLQSTILHPIQRRYQSSKLVCAVCPEISKWLETNVERIDAGATAKIIYSRICCCWSNCPARTLVLITSAYSLAYMVSNRATNSPRSFFPLYLITSVNDAPFCRLCLTINHLSSQCSDIPSQPFAMLINLQQKTSHRYGRDFDVPSTARTLAAHWQNMLPFYKKCSNR